MPHPLSNSILAFMYLGDIVFAVSGALTAGRHRMDIVGYLFIGTITGIGGGTLRDLLLGKTVWWTANPLELQLCLLASLVAYFFIRDAHNHPRWIVWLDALGLSSFAVVGCNVALEFGVPVIVAVFLGMLTATGGGLIRDVLTQTKPMILSAGDLYATAALGGAFIYAIATQANFPKSIAEFLGFLTVMGLRTLSIKFGLRVGPAGQLLRIRNRK